MTLDNLEVFFYAFAGGIMAMKVTSALLFKVKHPIFLAAISLNALLVFRVLNYDLTTAWLIPVYGFYPFFGLLSSDKNHNEKSTFFLSKQASILSLGALGLMIILQFTGHYLGVLTLSLSLFGLYLYNFSVYLVRFYPILSPIKKLGWAIYGGSIIASLVVILTYSLETLTADYILLLSLINISFLGAAIVYFYLRTYYQLIEKKRQEQDSLYKQNIALLSRNKHLAQKLLSLDNEALNNQINPHFLFNAMNSVNSLIIKKQSKSAEIYIEELKHFLTVIRAHETSSFYSLKEELEMLSSYVKLESLRKSSEVSFTFDVNLELDLTRVYIPHLFLQSCIENCFWHGFIDRQDGEISLKISSDKSLLFIEIKDNGIGINQSKEASAASAYQSAGMSILKKRIKTLSNHYDQHCEFRIEDRSDLSKLEHGTVVTISIPLISESPNYLK